MRRLHSTVRGFLMSKCHNGCQNEAFYSNGYCKECANRIAKQYNRKKPWIRMKSKLKAKYNITMEEYYDLYEKQGGRCAGCGRITGEAGWKLSVDHDHITGRIRGLLCVDCNLAVGSAKDSPIVLRQLALYLERDNPDLNDDQYNWEGSHE